MIQITPQMRVVVAVEPADFRKGIDGLARLCKEALRHDPFTGWVFVFRSRRALDLHALKMWLAFVANRRSHALWRMKGVLRCAGSDERVVVQAVYQWLELGPADGHHNTKRWHEAMRKRPSAAL